MDDVRRKNFITKRSLPVDCDKMVGGQFERDWRRSVDHGRNGQRWPGVSRATEELPLTLPAREGRSAGGWIDPRLFEVAHITANVF
jgi:hypothetical protein